MPRAIAGAARVVKKLGPNQLGALRWAEVRRVWRLLRRQAKTLGLLERVVQE